MEENYLKEEFITFVRVADNCTPRLTTQITLKKPLYIPSICVHQCAGVDIE